MVEVEPQSLTYSRMNPSTTMQSTRRRIHQNLCLHLKSPVVGQKSISDCTVLNCEDHCQYCSREQGFASCTSGQETVRVNVVR